MNGKEIISQDISVALNALDEKDVELINIVGNRILSNVLFFKDQNPFISGFILKEISLFLSKTMITEDEEEIILLTYPFIESLKELVENETSDLKKYWDIFYDFEIKSRSYSQKESEKKSYIENYDFSSTVVDYLIQLMSEKKDFFYAEGNSFLNGILNELVRILNNHGGTQKSYIIYSVIKSIGHLSNYCIREAVSTSGEYNSKILKTNLLPFIDEFIEICRTRDEENEFIVYMSKLMLKVLIEWRKYFIYYMEPNVPLFPSAPKIDLPVEFKRKMGKTILKALEKGMK